MNSVLPNLKNKKCDARDEALPIVFSQQSSVNNRQSAIGSRQSAIGSRQSAVGSRQSAIGSHFLLPISNSLLPTAHSLHCSIILLCLHKQKFYSLIKTINKDIKAPPVLGEGYYGKSNAT